MRLFNPNFAIAKFAPRPMATKGGFTGWVVKFIFRLRRKMNHEVKPEMHLNFFVALSGATKNSNAFFGFKNNAGFTFIEVFLTLLILGICFVPVVRMFSSSISEIAYIDDMQTAINLGREEVEKMKNLALTEDQIKTLGNVASQPILLNTKYWRTLRIIKQEAKPLEFTVVVFKGDDLNHPLVGVSTIIQK